MAQPGVNLGTNVAGGPAVVSNVVTAAPDTIVASAVSGAKIEALDHDLVRIANQIVAVLASRQKITATWVSCGNSLVLTLTGILRIYNYIISPGKWKLTRGDMEHVVSSVVLRNSREIRITLLNSPKKRSIELQELCWAEECWGPAPLCGAMSNPDIVPVMLEAHELSNPNISPLLVNIAKEVIASALVRDNSCKVSIQASADKDDTQIVCVVAITGLAVLSSRSFSPNRWVSLLHRTVTRTLVCYYNLESGEHRTRVTNDTVAKYFASLSVRPLSNDPIMGHKRSMPFEPPLIPEKKNCLN